MRSRALLVVVPVLGAALVAAALFGSRGNRAPGSGEPASPTAAHSGRESAPDAPPVPEAADASRAEIAAPAAATAEPGEAPKPSGGGAFSGRVASADGSPLGKATVRVVDAGGTLPMFARMAPRDAGFPAWTAECRADGAFEMSDLPEGKELLAEVTADGFLDEPVAPFTLGKRERRDLGTIRLTREAAIEGVVADSAGRPVEGVEIALDLSLDRVFRAGRLSFSETKTDAEGRFRLARLRPGKVRLLATAPGWRESKSDEIELEAGESVSGVEIRLSSGRAIAGRVFGRDGKPVANARVFASTEDSAAGAGPFRFSRRDPVRTDADGRYEVGGLAEGSCRIEVEADGFAGANRTGVPVGTATADFTLDPLGKLVGRVADGATGTPVPGVRARALRSGEPFMRFAGEEPAAATATDDGSFEIPGLDPGSWRIEVKGEGFSPLEAGPFAVAAGASVDAGTILLRPGAALTVRVVEAGNRAPVAGAAVALEPAEPAGGGGVSREIRSIGRRMRLPRAAGARFGDLLGGEEALERKTDAEGVAAFGDLRDGAYRVAVREKAHATIEVDATVAAGAPTEIEVSLTKGGEVTGRVSRANGEPFPGARIYLARAVGEGNLDETADADGVYRFAHVPAGDWRVGISDDEAGSFVGGSGRDRMMIRIGGVDANASAGTPVTVVEGETATVDLRETDRSAVTGRVTEAGAPASGVRVTLTPEGRPVLPFLSDLTAETGSDGRFRVEGVNAGRYTLTAAKPGAAVPAEESVDVAGAETVVDVALPRGVVEGRILDAATGRGLPGAEVTLSRDRREASGGRPRAERAMAVAFTTSSSGGGHRTVRFGGGPDPVKTDAEGRFRLEGVPPGSYALSASLEGFADGTREGLAVERDGALRDVDVPLGKGGWIRGTVTDVAGSAAPFTLVEVVPEKGETKRTVASPDGTFEVKGLSAGVYEVVARRPGPNERRSTQPGVRVEAGRETAVDLRLPE